jgi:flagellar biosynthesis/type III secretory pathway M-ring protein FliF/YscJ|tara:strand:+ start:239 stop:385 length:147 start_codon:yes stop_codon:yes gene_type:complete
MKKFNELSKKHKILLIVVGVIVVGFIGDAAGLWEMSSVIPGGGGEGAA